jgi:3-methyladenine DNA glycosylase AlkC
MAEAIKHVLNGEAVRWLADSLLRAYPRFDATAFIDACHVGLDGMELKQRAAHIGACMGKFLPEAFPDAAKIVGRSLGPEVSPTGQNGLSVLRYMPHDSFIEHFGLDHPDAAFALQAEVTKRASCEFSIRAFLLRHPEKTYAQMLVWARAGNAHLRRLASEGSRPRLPWGVRLPAFQKDPTPVISLLEVLKDDPVRYVQRSVANSINDIGKDHPDLAVDLCRAWLGEKSGQSGWIVGHAMRTLVRKGHAGALSLLHVGAKPRIEILRSTIEPGMPRIGGRISISVEVRSAGRATQNLLANLRVHFVKANGRSAPKVFKLKRFTLAPEERAVLAADISVADMTTRKHHPGVHRVELVVNGQAFPVGAFELLP